MKRFVALSLLCMAVAISGRAQQTSAPQHTERQVGAQQADAQASAPKADADAPATKEEVEAYLAVTHSKELATKMMAAMVKPMHQTIHEQYLKNKDKLPPDCEARMNQQMDDMLKNMPFDEMMEAMVSSYQKHFTKGDMEALVTFYSSATGQKILNEMPAIVAESMQNMMPIMQKYTNNLQQQLQQQVAEMLQQASPQVGKNPAPTAN
jgi:uncharacterized protein